MTPKELKAALPPSPFMTELFFEVRSGEKGIREIIFKIPQVGTLMSIEAPPGEVLDITVFKKE